MPRSRPRERRLEGRLARDYERTLGRVAANVRQLRLRAKLTQEALAEAADLSTISVALVEGRRTNVTIGTLCALAAALDVDVARLLRPVRQSGATSPTPKVRPRKPGRAVEP